MTKKPILIASLCLLMATPVFKASAQDNCGGAVVNATALYEQGKLREAIDAMKPCLTLSLNRTNLWQGYKILALSYLALNDQKDARIAAENMLEQNPLYVPSLLKDPKDFIDLVNSIVVIPRFSLGLAVAAGINNTYVDVTQQYNASNFTKNYTSNIGTQFGFVIGYNISNELSVGADLNGSFKNYSINYSTNDFNITDNEHLSFLEVPVYATYSYGKGKLRPFVRLGAYEDFLLSASSDFSATYQPDKTSYSDKGVNSNDRRNNTDFGLLGGIGLNWKFDPAWQAFIEFRYTYGLTNVVNDANRYSDQNLIFNYFYLDDDLKISNGLFTLGFVYNLNYKVIRQKWN